MKASRQYRARRNSRLFVALLVYGAVLSAGLTLMLPSPDRPAELITLLQRSL